MGGQKNGSRRENREGGERKTREEEEKISIYQL